MAEEGRILGSFFSRILVSKLLLHSILGNFPASVYVHNWVPCSVWMEGNSYIWKIYRLHFIRSPSTTTQRTGQHIFLVSVQVLSSWVILVTVKQFFFPASNVVYSIVKAQISNQQQAWFPSVSVLSVHRCCHHMEWWVINPYYGH